MGRQWRLPHKEPSGPLPQRAQDYTCAPCPLPQCMGVTGQGNAHDMLDLKSWRAHVSAHVNALLAGPAVDTQEGSTAASSASRPMPTVTHLAHVSLMAARAGWRFCTTCCALRKPGPGQQPADPVERRRRLDCEPGSRCRTDESPQTTLSVRDATLYRRSSLLERAALTSPVRSAAPATPGPELVVPVLPRPTIQEMASAGLSRGRVYGNIPLSCLNEYRALHKRITSDCAHRARTHGPQSIQTTHAVQNQVLLTHAVARRLYRGEDGQGNEALETAALRARIRRALAGDAALVELWHEAAAAACNERDLLERDPRLKSEAVREMAAAGRRLNKASALAERAQYGRALRTLMFTTPADMSDADVLAQLRALHPQRDPVQPAPVESLPTATRPSRKLLKKVLRRMDDHSAAGPDGMPVRHLKLLASVRTGETASDSGLAALHSYCALMASGALSTEAAQFHSWATLLASRKPSGAYRPLAIGTVYRRMVSCAMLKIALPGARSYFQPHQIANGVPAGTEAAIHAFREVLDVHREDDSRAALFVDARNAFNEIDRQRILDAVMVHAPAIARYVHMVYGCGPWLVAGMHLIQSLQGTQQGDPLGMFLFSLVLQELVDLLQARCNLDLNVWCADDGTLIGTIAQLAIAASLLALHGPALGFHVEATKTRAWWPVVDWESDTKLPFGFFTHDTALEHMDHTALSALHPLLSDGVRMLGSPVGTDLYVQTLFQKRMNRIDELLSAVSELQNPHTAMHMHRLCASVVQIVHILRSTPPSQTLPLLPAFDAQQERWLNSLLPGVPQLDADALAQTSLDVCDGGLGLLPACVVSVPAYVGSRIDTARAVAQLPSQRTHVEMTSHLPSLLSTCYARFDVYPETEPEALISSLLLTPGHSQKIISKVIQTTRAAKFWPKLQPPSAGQDFAELRKLSRFKSISSPASRAWFSILPCDYDIPPDTWCLWIQRLLGAPIYDVDPVCNTCDQPMDRYGDHALANCKKGYGRSARHNRLVRAFRDTAVTQAGVPARLEEADLFPGMGDRPGDVFVPSPAGCLPPPVTSRLRIFAPSDSACTVPAFEAAAYDFTVRGAIPDSGVPGTVMRKSCSDAAAAASFAEEDKAASFKAREEALAIRRRVRSERPWRRSFQFCPFGVDVFGSLGPSALTAIDHFAKLRAARYCHSTGASRRRILQRISVSLHSENAKMLQCRRPMPSTSIPDAAAPVGLLG